MIRLSLLLLLVAGLATPVVALPLKADFAMRSDYRNRGLSVTNRRPVLQGNFTLDLPAGGFALAAVSPFTNDGRGVELVLGGGISRKWRGTEFQLSANASLYPGQWRDNLFEIGASATRPVGPVELGVSLVYAPPQRSTGHGANLYSAVSARLPLAHTPFALRGTAGIESGALGHGKRDWSLGSEVEVRGLTLGADWVGSSRTAADPMGRSALVFSVSREI
ncbi:MULTISPECIES: TorF family putative porin [Sphingomonas]|uniref:TorF family putative porin n=1 Tax=Sphingomonas TaxID=13687 RepID=UPI000DEF518F|nr:MULTISPECIES: TorF family putative porin [Sphingomonas]